MTVQSPLIVNVDDTESVRYVKTRTLRHAGFRVEEAVSGEEALRKVRELRPALVMLDVQLPDISGTEVCKVLRRDFPGILILQVSASHVTSDDRVMGLESGADSYLVQPVEPAELIAAVRALLRIRSAEEDLRKLNETLEARIEDRTRQLVDANQRLTTEIAERRKAETSLLQAQKTEAIGQLTGGIAHDFNNLLMVISSNLHLLQKRLPEDDTIRRYFDGAKQGAERGVALTQRLLAFARKQDLAAQPVSIPELIANLRGMIVQSLGAMVRLDIDTPEAIATAYIDPNQLELVILNLCVNSRDAMDEDGRLLISLREESWPGSELLAPGNYVVLQIADNGRGMDAATLARATEPFFSTKEVGKGTGLGLAMVHGFLQQSGGALMLASELGKGTIADLWIPISDQPVAVGAEQATESWQSRPLNVLVVDDEALLTMATADTLKELGHSPLEAISGAEALNMLAANPQIELMITDHAMPRMTGVELAKRAREFRPDLKIILASGYVGVPDGGDIELKRLAKPYHERELVAAIEELFRD